MKGYEEEFQKIILLFNENKFIEAKELFETVMLKEVSKRMLDKKDEIIEKLKLGELNEKVTSITDVEQELKKKNVKFKSKIVYGKTLITIETDEYQGMPDRGNFYEFDSDYIKSLGKCDISVSDHPEYRTETTNGFEVNYVFKGKDCTVYISEM